MKALDEVLAEDGAREISRPGRVNGLLDAGRSQSARSARDDCAVCRVAARVRHERPLADRLELAAPGLAALAARLLARLPEPARRRALEGAFDRARDAFNRGDLEAVFALFSRPMSNTVRPLPCTRVSLCGVVRRCSTSGAE